MIRFATCAGRRAVLAAAMIAATALPALAGSGTFQGLSGHTTTGKVSVEARDGGHVVVLHGDFSFDGAPDPRIGFGSGGKFAKGTDFEPLKSNTGAQEYKVPAGIDAAQFSNVFVWCRKYSVALGVATLK